jgi:hypothetical protein
MLEQQQDVAHASCTAILHKPTLQRERFAV